MTIRSLPFLAGFVGLAAFATLLVPAARAATGTDDASGAAYKADDKNASNDANQKDNTNGWVNGDNGGSGFKPWELSSSDDSTTAFFLGNSRGLAAGQGGDINSKGFAFGLLGKGTEKRADAIRLFEAPLSAGQTFSIELAVNYRNGNKGFDLRDADGNAIFNFNVGNDDYFVNMAATGNGSVGGEYNSNTVFKLEFTQTSKTEGKWTVTRVGGSAKPVTGTYKGQAVGIKLYLVDTEEGGDNNLMANHLTIAGGQ